MIVQASVPCTTACTGYPVTETYKIVITYGGIINQYIFMLCIFPVAQRVHWEFYTCIYWSVSSQEIRDERAAH